MVRAYERLLSGGALLVFFCKDLRINRANPILARPGDAIFSHFLWLQLEHEGIKRQVMPITSKRGSWIFIPYVICSLQQKNLERNFGYTPPKFNIDIENNQTFEAGDTVSKPFFFWGGIHVACLGYKPIDFTIYHQRSTLSSLAADIGMVKSSIFVV